MSFVPPGTGKICLGWEIRTVRLAGGIRGIKCSVESCSNDHSACMCFLITRYDDMNLRSYIPEGRAPFGNADQARRISTESTKGLPVV